MRPFLCQLQNDMKNHNSKNIKHIRIIGLHVVGLQHDHIHMIINSYRLRLNNTIEIAKTLFLLTLRFF